ncbi:MAG: NAD(P)/FAD-dependent oxidoreductase, partial [Paracoccaceae bacterium]
MIAHPDIKDCVIVGGGPAGLTAALYLARFLRSVTVFDAQDGRARLIPKTHNLAPFPDGISGRDLLDRMRTHAELYGATVEPGTVRSVEKLGDRFDVTTDIRTVTARTVIFATGVFNHRPPLSAEDHTQGLARGLIRYCPVCDAHEVRDRRIAVLGNGEHGAREARFLSHYSPYVTLLPSDGSVGVPPRGIAALDAAMKSMSLSGSEVIVSLQTGAFHRFDTLYVALGTTARVEVKVDPAVDLSSNGHIVVDERYRTNIDGAYGIGDVTEGLDQIAVAMGQGAIAATAIHNSLHRTTRGTQAQRHDPKPAGVSSLPTSPPVREVLMSATPAFRLSPVSPAEHSAVVDAIHRALTAREESGKAGIAASVLCDGRMIATGENE